MRNKKIYIIATCLKVIGTNRYDFHFKGWFMGQRVERLVLEGQSFEICKEYLVSANVINCHEGVLVCETITSKPIFNRSH
ncbi:MAG: hypothetical protein CME64_15465 [Halobacteriovoraceae bacterium]|nr:hypothetical protein [Halobacteriovoraceae bacterium]